MSWLPSALSNKKLVGVIGGAVVLVAGTLTGLGVSGNLTDPGCSSPHNVGMAAAIQIACPAPGATTTTLPTSTTSTTGVVGTGGFPNATNTGVPAGTTLTAYTGSHTITSCGTVIDSKIISGNLDIRASNGTKSAATPCVTIKNSKVNGDGDGCTTICGGGAAIDMAYSSSTACTPAPCGPLVITDSEVSGPTPNFDNQAAIYETNYYATRINEHGYRTGALCDGWCSITDSYIHDMWYVSGEHMGAFLTNGNGSGPITLNHNTLSCNLANPSAQDGSGGCSADANFYGDFSAVNNTTVTNNLMVASGGQFFYCAYSGGFIGSKSFPTGNNLHWSNNVFQKGSSGVCGDSGPLFDWQCGNGNVGNSGGNNLYDDGTVVTQFNGC